ncbi:MAG: 1-deoxy-D-xylulose-5-phosphate synthase [bacterium]
MSDILSTINSPDDLRALNIDQLPLLADEIRKLIIATVSRVGGHMASSLGVVELTLALHYIFKTPEDRLVWDVGHQAYAHKIITGRRDQFATLRQFGGLSGFPKREESVYDTFDTGHSSTSISAAIGMIEGMRLKEKNSFTVPVIGDGSMTAGMAFEALNHAGTLKHKMIIVLNDNDMSISPNVGGMTKYLNRITTGQFYHRLKKEAEHLLKSIPPESLGDSMYKMVDRLKDAIKALLVSPTMFEELGLEYVGPIDGHDLDELLETFEAVKLLEGPILVHVATKKGKGYAPAENQPHLFHSAPPFDIKTGKFKKKKNAPKSYTETFSDTMVELAENDPRIIAITAAMKEGTGLVEFAERFPERFYDVGIAEQHAVTFAAGLAVKGFKPVAAIYSTFLQRAYDQVLHDVCLQKLPVTFALDRAGIVGADGPTHNGIYDFSYMTHLPNMVVMAPKDENELRHMIKTSLELEQPSSVRYPRGSGLGIERDKEITALPVGKAEILEGDINKADCAILAIGNRVYPSLKAAKELSGRGVRVSVVNLRFAKPLDEETIFMLADKVGRLVTVEDNVVAGGVGGAVLQLLSGSGRYGVKVKCIGLPDMVGEHGTPGEIYRLYHLDAEAIAQTVSEFIGK